MYLARARWINIMCYSLHFQHIDGFVNTEVSSIYMFGFFPELSPKLFSKLSPAVSPNIFDATFYWRFRLTFQLMLLMALWWRFLPAVALDGYALDRAGDLTHRSQRGGRPKKQTPQFTERGRP